MERQYFDNTLLAQFYVTKMPVTVYVDGNLLKIVDADDITDAYIGNGMLPSGEMHPFDYRDIQFIMIGKNKYTIEDINKAFAAKEEPKPAAEPKAKEEPKGEEEKEEQPKESIKRGRNMAKSITEKLGFGQVSEPYTIQTGDMVHNVNPQCNHFGSKGIANGVFDEDGITMIRYTVTNQGDTFKPGDMLTKSMDQMNVMDMGDTDFDMSDEEEVDIDSYDLDGDEDDFLGFGDDEGMFDDEAWDEENWEEEEDFEDEEYEEEEEEAHKEEEEEDEDY